MTGDSLGRDTKRPSDKVQNMGIMQATDFILCPTRSHGDGLLEMVAAPAAERPAPGTIAIFALVEGGRGVVGLLGNAAAPSNKGPALER